MANNQLPFGIDFVVNEDIVPLGFKKYPNKEGYTINCPFCEKKGLAPDRKHKLCVNITNNVAHCFRCNTGVNIIGLHQEYMGCSYREAKQDLFKRYNGLPSDIQKTLNKGQEQIKLEREKRLEPAPIKFRDIAYRRFLACLDLKAEHKAALMKRGLNEEEIERGLYKSVPVIGYNTFAREVFNDYELGTKVSKNYKWGIPGFYDIRTDEPKLIQNTSGIYIPVLNQDGLISHLQIRFDELPNSASELDKEYWSKYKPYTSDYRNKKDGCSTKDCENIHYAGNWRAIPESVMLTEGILKANVASFLAGKIKGCASIPMLAIDGVNKHQQLIYELSDLKSKGLKEVVLCLDMDYKTKPQVKAAMDRIEHTIKHCELEVKHFDWNSQFKGIDDYLLAVYKYRKDNN